MNFHPRPRYFRSTLIGSSFLVVLAVGLFVADRSHDANAQNPDRPKGDSVIKPIINGIDDRSCLDALRHSCDRLAHCPESDSVLRYTCHVETEMADTVLPTSIADVHISLNATRLQAVSEFFEFYRDSISVFTVIPITHTIYRSDPTSAPEKDMFGNVLNAGWMRDSILLKSRILECSTSTDAAGHSLQTIRLSPNPDIRYDLNVGEFTVVVDKDDMLPVRMTITPMQPELYKSITWMFSDIRVEPSTESYRQSLVTMFDNGKGKLKSAWAGYTLVDNRCESLVALIDN